jgi:phosphatidylglycerophosphate synthase
MNIDNIKKTYKSNDTEEWLDRVWTRPIGYWWAKQFERLGVHPNTVTVLSMIIGAASALFFAHGSYWLEGWRGLTFNILGVLLLAWANFYDSADGQLARMTGQKTLLGRILDGAASEVWFIPIYLSLVYRFYVYHDRDFAWLGIADTPQNTLVATLVVLAAVCVSGFVCHSGQCALADYYRQIHLYFLKGEAGSELDNSVQQQKLYDETPWQKGSRLYKLFLKTYVGYTRRQERRTPGFQRLIGLLRERYGSADQLPQWVRSEFRQGSLPLMTWANVLTFNTRAIVLYLCCLIDLPLVYFVFEIVVMSLLCEWMRRRHERLCNQIYDKLLHE